MLVDSDLVRPFRVVKVRAEKPEQRSYEIDRRALIGSADVLWMREERAQRAQRRDRVAGQIAKILDGYLEERESSQTPKETATPLLKAKFLDAWKQRVHLSHTEATKARSLEAWQRRGNSQLNTDFNHKASTQQGISAPPSTQQSVQKARTHLGLAELALPDSQALPHKRHSGQGLSGWTQSPPPKIVPTVVRRGIPETSDDSAMRTEATEQGNAGASYPLCALIRRLGALACPPGSPNDPGKEKSYDF
ncbi:hypothetical protein EAI_04707 [Harpegnathos saltator]|uniref:Uncharacterized protein n=1 Tax=Harpegnathos saltator TaxID=610380 RepID=E2BTQ7_HARSA|nr:hypothetical protein EAI_04707 [Harpegnathos saltator]